MRTAESVVLTPWPPAPPERNTSMRRSTGLIVTSTSSASGSTATVTVDVWIASLRLGRGHALHAVHAAFPLQAAVNARPWISAMISLKPPNARRVGREHVDLPALAFGVPLVEAKELAHEKRGLVAAGAGADFEDDVLVVVGIFREAEESEALFLDSLELGLKALELVFRHRGDLGVFFAEQLLVGLAAPSSASCSADTPRPAPEDSRAPAKACGTPRAGCPGSGSASRLSISGNGFRRLRVCRT